ncbi:MAG: succinate dehydrogenase/fumarate reductase iron-sulfur subunit [Gemmatimonadota bacterium]
MAAAFHFRIFRFDPAVDLEPRYQAYEIELEPSLSVLEALLALSEEQDPSLSFRCSCRGAACGSCGMTINGAPDLACRRSLQSLGTDQITVEPLTKLEVAKDLVVEMGPFWEAYERVRPFLHPTGPAPDREHHLTAKQAVASQPYTDCVLCACCYSACPVLGSDPAYLGPAALSKLYRFVSDPRDGRGPAELAAADGAGGAWGCHTVLRCVEACPKGIRPVDGIRGVRRRLLADRLKGLFRRP